LREKFKKDLEGIVKQAEHRLDSQRDYFDLKNRVELSEVKERTDGQIASLMSTHQKAYSDLKIYYNDITHNNLSLISTLKVRKKGPVFICKI
jgi:hypothetical protein